MLSITVEKLKAVWRILRMPNSYTVLTVPKMWRRIEKSKGQELNLNG